MARRTHRDILGSLLGIAVFLAGIALLLLVFRLAYDMFGVPPQDALNLKSGKPVDFAVTGSSLAGIFIRIVLLVVMGLVGSLIANRGVGMYTHSKHVIEESKETA